MEIMTQNELMITNGGEITLDINKLVDQVNPVKVCYDFGHDVVYPYIYKPVTDFFSGKKNK